MDQPFYSLDEAAEELGCKINELLKWGAAGKVQMCIYYIGGDFSAPPVFDKEYKEYFRPRVEKLLTISKEDIMRAYQQHNELLNEENNQHFDFVELVDWHISYKVTPHFSSKSLYLMSETYDTLKAELQEKSIESVVPCLDENHEFHARELKIAIEAWTALFEEKVKGNPSTIKEKAGGPRPTIISWLEGNYPDESETACERIATVINPFKGGGAPKKNK